MITPVSQRGSSLGRSIQRSSAYWSWIDNTVPNACAQKPVVRRQGAGLPSWWCKGRRVAGDPPTCNHMHTPPNLTGMRPTHTRVRALARPGSASPKRSADALSRRETLRPAPGPVVPAPAPPFGKQSGTCTRGRGRQRIAGRRKNSMHPRLCNQHPHPVLQGALGLGGDGLGRPCAVTLQHNCVRTGGVRSQGRSGLGKSATRPTRESRRRPPWPGGPSMGLQVRPCVAQQTPSPAGQKNPKGPAGERKRALCMRAAGVRVPM
jgi:hypothetical protein